MKKIKNFVLAFAAVCLTAGLASCSKDEKIVEKPVEVIVEKTDTVKVEVPVEVPQDNNWSRYQAIVTEDVKSQTKHDKAILLVAFGSTWEQAYDAFDSTIDAYKAAYEENNNIVKYSYPYNSKDNNIVINFSLINQGNYIINIFFNDIKSEKTYEINENKKIIIEQNQFTDKCKYDNQICKISFIVESKNLDESILQMTVSLDDGKEEGSSNNTNGQDTSPISNIVLTLIIIGGISILIIIFTLIYLCIIRKKNKDLSKEVSSISFSNKDEDKDVPLNDV